MDLLVSTDWLEGELGARDLRILDATWCLPADGRDPRAEYLEAHTRTNRLGVEANNTSVRVLSLRQSAEENERRAQQIARSLPAGLRGAAERQP